MFFSSLCRFSSRPAVPPLIGPRFPRPSGPAHATGRGRVHYRGFGEEGEQLLRAAVSNANYERLARVKAKYDPENLFRQNHNIKPTVS